MIFNLFARVAHLKNPIKQANSATAKEMSSSLSKLHSRLTALRGAPQDRAPTTPAQDAEEYNRKSKILIDNSKVVAENEARMRRNAGWWNYVLYDPRASSPLIFDETTDYRFEKYSSAVLGAKETVSRWKQANKISGKVVVMGVASRDVPRELQRFQVQ